MTLGQGCVQCGGNRPDGGSYVQNLSLIDNTMLQDSIHEPKYM